jgi:uncharacterized protein YecE (DUF72 family)
MTMNGLRIGTAAWAIPRAVAEEFPAEGGTLQRYAAVFNCVEINSSFYKPHKPETYARWADSVGDEFRFALKLPRTITHDARLGSPGPGAAGGIAGLLDSFAAETAALGRKLGCVLVQLPPSLAFEGPAVRAAQATLTALRARFGCLLACEARHATWFGAEASALLRELGITRVIADPCIGEPGPYLPTSETPYVRLHGSPRVYFSSYEPERLAKVKGWLREQRDAWCIFDNTASGAATANALALLR